MRFVFLLMLCGIMLLACDSNRVYEYDAELSERMWKVSDTSAFEFVIRDVNKKYNLYYSVRNSLDYPWARLFVQYSLRDTTGKKLQGSLITSLLFDVKTGKPQGSSGLGDVYDHQFPLLKNYTFTHPGKYTLRLQQFMRTDSLKGVLAVGVRVESAN